MTIKKKLIKFGLKLVDNLDKNILLSNRRCLMFLQLSSTKIWAKPQEEAGTDNKIIPLGERRYLIKGIIQYLRAH